MRGAGDQMTVGERIKFYRRRRGLTQEVLANLVGRKVDWLSKIERGERDIRRLDVISDVARALRVTVPDLFGQPVLMEDDEQNDDIPAVRDALMTPKRLSRTLFGVTAEPVNVNPEASARFVEEAWDAYQSGRLGRVVGSLPGLIETAQQLEDAANAGSADVRACWAVSARTHHLAATALSKAGEADLSWIAAERAMQSADNSGDPLVLASAARAGTHALLAVGRFDDALSLGNTASGWLAPQMANGDPSALSLYGMAARWCPSSCSPASMRPTLDNPCGTSTSPHSARPASTSSTVSKSGRCTNLARRHPAKTCRGLHFCRPSTTPTRTVQPPHRPTRTVCPGRTPSSAVYWCHPAMTGFEPK